MIVAAPEPQARPPSASIAEPGAAIERKGFRVAKKIIFA
jgi:hypothetical protein